MFLNPLGYDQVFKFVYNHTGKDYWRTDHILLACAITAFIVWFVVGKINPIKHIYQQIVKLKDSVSRFVSKRKNRSLSSN